MLYLSPKRLYAAIKLRQVLPDDGLVVIAISLYRETNNPITVICLTVKLTDRQKMLMTMTE